MVIGLIAFFSLLILLVVLVFLNARWLAMQLPFSAEKRFVEPYERLVRNVYDQEASDGDRAIEEYLQELVDELSRDMDVPSEIEISVHYVDAPTVNAFATLGGHVFVFEGLLAAMPDENSLSMVLAHEAAHIKHRDPVAHLGRGFALGMLISFVTGGEGGSGEMAGRGGELGLLYFSREQETMADRAAIAALEAHYGHVAGYATMFRALDQAHPDADSQLEWLSSHPHLSDRVEALERLAERRGWQTAEPQPIPERIRHAIKE
jgi:predicted Zn-dependent protease